MLSKSTPKWRGHEKIKYLCEYVANVAMIEKTRLISLLHVTGLWFEHYDRHLRKDNTQTHDNSNNRVPATFKRPRNQCPSITHLEQQGTRTPYPPPTTATLSIFVSVRNEGRLIDADVTGLGTSESIRIAWQTPYLSRGTFASRSFFVHDVWHGMN